MDDYQCPEPIRSYKIKLKVIKVEKANLEQYWAGYKNGQKQMLKSAWEAGFKAAIETVKRLHAGIDTQTLLSFINILDKTIPEEKAQEWDPNVRNDEII